MRQTLKSQIWHFVIHLRWHYQLFILSGGYLLGGFLSTAVDWNSFVLQFLNVHLLLFGGATAFNSYWDKDEGPVGGLREPPPMKPWMWSASLAVQGAGLLLALPAGAVFTLIYALSISLFWLYSTPHARWKGDPWKSLVAIGISTGTNSLLMGYLAALPSSNSPGPWIWCAALGVAAVVLSLYPLSQIYQRDTDRARGDQTFAIRYGTGGTVRFFRWLFPTGILLISAAMYQYHPGLAALFATVGAATWIWVALSIRRLDSTEEDYRRVMKIKYRTSLAFVLFLAAAILIKHTGLGILWGLDLLLR